MHPESSLKKRHRFFFTNIRITIIVKSYSRILKRITIISIVPHNLQRICLRLPNSTSYRRKKKYSYALGSAKQYCNIEMDSFVSGTKVKVVSLQDNVQVPVNYYVPVRILPFRVKQVLTRSKFSGQKNHLRKLASRRLECTISTRISCLCLLLPRYRNWSI
jgi:hypothetical protein